MDSSVNAPCCSPLERCLAVTFAKESCFAVYRWPGSKWNFGTAQTVGTFSAMRTVAVHPSDRTEHPATSTDSLLQYATVVLSRISSLRVCEKREVRIETQCCKVVNVPFTNENGILAGQVFGILGTSSKDKFF